MRQFFSSLSGESGKGGLTLAIFVLLAAGLFFVPEIISVQRSLFSSSESTEKDDSASTVVEEPSEVPSEPQKKSKAGETPDAAPLKGKPGSAVERLGKVLKKLEDNALDLTGGSDIDIQTLPKERRAVALMLREEKLSWRLLRNKEVKGVVSETLKSVKLLLKAVPERYGASRFALLSYANGLTSFLRGDARQIPPEEYLEFLVFLENSVTQAMAQERVQEGTYSQWRNMSLVPILSQASQEMKRQHSPPFLATIVLSDVLVRTSPPGRSSVPTYSVRIQGYVVGSEARKLEVYFGRQKVSEVRLAAPPERKRFTFAENKISRDPVVTLRVVDEFGRKIQRRYQFINRARRFPLGRDGSYQVPSIGKVLANAPLSRRVDSLFALSPVVSSGREGLDAFGGRRSSGGGFSSFSEGGGAGYSSF